MSDINPPQPDGPISGVQWNSINRRKFLKRTGGVTVASLIGWGLNSNVAFATTGQAGNSGCPWKPKTRVFVKIIWISGTNFPAPGVQPYNFSSSQNPCNSMGWNYGQPGDAAPPNSWPNTPFATEVIEGGDPSSAHAGGGFGAVPRDNASSTNIQTCKPLKSIDQTETITRVYTDACGDGRRRWGYKLIITRTYNY